MKKQFRFNGEGFEIEIKQNLWGIILAGGEGKRLSNFIKRIYGFNKPKQYCNLTGIKSLIKHTHDRALLEIKPERLMTIVNMDDLPYVMEELGEQPPETFAVQPSNRDTCAGILFPMLKIFKRDQQAIVATFPSDHFIYDEIKFMSYVKNAYEFVNKNPAAIIMLGINPHKFEPGYGWIEKGKSISSPAGNISSVKKFWEKPEYDIALKLLSQGSLWNTFVLIGKAETFIRYMRIHAKKVYSHFEKIFYYINTPMEMTMLYNIFDNIPPINFSSSVLEKIKEKLFVMEVPDVYWSDWGEEHRIFADAEKYGFQLPSSINLSGIRNLINPDMRM